jgi:DNA-binding transcriptional regulator YdaS (Cro superfamily)
MMPGLDTLDVLRMLRQACDAAGGQAIWATRNGVSPQFVCDVLNARRDLTPRIWEALNLRRVVRYLPTNGGAHGV